jgi:hypothetical protein
MKQSLNRADAKSARRHRIEVNQVSSSGSHGK